MNTMSVPLLAAVTIASEVELAPIVVTMLSGLVIPVLVGLVTKSAARPPVKQVATILLSGVAALVASSTMIDGSAVFSVETALLAGMAWLMSVASYLGVYQPLDLNDRMLPGSGLGRAVEIEKG